jgi:hypothetical protein
MKFPLVVLLLALAVSLSAAPISPSTHGLVMLIADSMGVPRSVANWLQVEESGDWRTGQWGDASAIGPVGADGSRCLGLYQLNPRWMPYLVELYFPHPAMSFDAFDPLQNATVALGYLAALHRRFGSWDLALIYFNCGRVVDVPEGTREYATRICKARALLTSAQTSL